jgi:hypothetical protein
MWYQGCPRTVALLGIIHFHVEYSVRRADWTGFARARLYFLYTINILTSGSALSGALRTVSFCRRRVYTRGVS